MRVSIKVMGAMESFRPPSRSSNATRSLRRSDPERMSSKGRFLALTYTIRAESRAQLDRIYQDLTDSGVVLVAL